MALGCMPGPHHTITLTKVLVRANWKGLDQAINPKNTPFCQSRKNLWKLCGSDEKHTVKMFFASFWNILFQLLLFPDFVFNILTLWEKIWIQYYYGKMPPFKICVSETLHFIGKQIFHNTYWNRDQSDCGITILAGIQPSAEHGPEQTHVIGPVWSSALDLSFSEPTYIILYSVM